MLPNADISYIIDDVALFLPQKPWTMTQEHIAVARFREFLRIKTVQPNPDYKRATEFFKDYAQELQLDHEMIEVGYLNAQ